MCVTTFQHQICDALLMGVLSGIEAHFMAAASARVKPSQTSTYNRTEEVGCWVLPTVNVPGVWDGQCTNACLASTQT